MDWNAYFASGGNQPFNFVPREFPGGNPAVFQNGSENWPYYAYNQNYVPEQQVLAPGSAPAQPYGGVYAQPLPGHSREPIAAGDPLNRVAPEHFGAENDALAIAAMSSLTATANEFIPQFKMKDSSESTSTVEVKPSTPVEDSQVLNNSVKDERTKPITKKTNNVDSRSYTSKNNIQHHDVTGRSGNAESRYYSNKNAAQGQEASNKNNNSESKLYLNKNSSQGRDNNGRKSVKNASVSSNNNSRSCNVEDSKNRDRQRLLAHAAAFYPSAANEDGGVDMESSNTVQKQSDSKTSSDSQENRSRDTSYRGRGQQVHGSGRMELKQKTFVNSRYSGRGYEQPSNSRGFSSQSDNTVYNTRGRRYAANQSTEESLEHENHYQYSNKYENNYGANNFGSGGSRYSRERNNFSPRVNDSRGGSGTTNSYFTSRGRNESLRGERGERTDRTVDDEASQRERLSDQLQRGTLECLVCCDRVRQHDPTWSCNNCYHVLHLKCIKKWAKSSKADAGWRCPACQNVTGEVPEEYRCFCGQIRDPEWNRQDVPHSCGELCGRLRLRPEPLHPCTHKCTLLCHPGPCPPCVAQVNRPCGCGKTSQVVKCGTGQPLLCGAPCEKDLNCGVHKCPQRCHMGPCGDCQQVVKQTCFCGKTEKEVPCNAETCSVTHFSCGEVCDKELACTHHQCTLVCHEGPCIECALAPERVTHCPCGKMPLPADNPRTSCLDPVPTCEQPCEKKLSCGQPGNHHICANPCHPGACPPCPKTTFVKCRCGHMDKEMDCAQLTTKADDARCEKRCTKKRSCGRHKCNQTCCIDLDHVCPLPCNRTLPCGQHRCEELCHRGNCQPCYRTSFEELYCECGASVIYPPVPCGTRRPACDKPCSRPHPCGHEPLHNCHSDPTCPPCSVLVQKYCYGKHELRKAVLCCQTEFSCGRPCGKPLVCGRHTCISPCHTGDCLKPGQVCTQPCKTDRTLCGHPCAAPCHEGPCPDTPCKETVRVTCECGHVVATRPCCDQAKEYQRVMTALLASKMQDMQMGHSVEIGDLTGSAPARALSLKTLECNDECKIIDRNRRLCIGLQLRNPDLSGKLQPRYSEYLRQWAKKDPHFVASVHEKLTELVQLAKQSKQKSRSYSFSSMNREKRHFIHEYCEHFGCESQAYDPEPNRNVVATALKDKSWLPGMSLLEVLQRESGQRKAPRPVTAWAVDAKIKEGPLPTRTLNQSLKAKIEEERKEEKKEEKKEEEKKEEPDEIDYFEMTS